MKRIVTGFLLTFFAFAVSAQTQVQTTTHVAQKMLPQAATMKQAQTASSGINPVSPDKNDQPLAALKTEAVSYFPDTTNGNWWVYGMILNNALGDSLSFFHPNMFNGGESLYLANADSIGDQGILFNGQPITFNDTMYERSLALRVTPPTDLGTRLYLDSANVVFFVESMDPGDEIRVLAVPIDDQELSNNTGPFPFPAVFPSDAIASGSISGSNVTAGQINAMTVSFGGGGKQITNASEKNEFAIAVYVDGPNFMSDTIGYLLEADPNTEITGGLTIDTDGTLSSQTGLADVDGNPIPMRTYLMGLDGGNVSYQGTALGYISGGEFFINTPQLGADGTQTGESYDGNVAITTYFHGTVAAGVTPTELAGYGLGEVYPNPVSTTTTINYNLGVSGPVTLEVYNVLGQNVGTIVNGVQGAGEHTATFNAGTLPDGMYYYKLQSGEFIATNSMLIAR